MEDNIIQNSIILDTHVILWSLLQPEEITDSVKQIISDAQSQDRLLLSSISLWEIAMLKVKKRINIYEPIKEFLKSIEGIEGIEIVGVSSDIAAESMLLVDNFYGDPADRIIAATAINKSAHLLTRDKQILSWAELGNVRVIKV